MEMSNAEYHTRLRWKKSSHSEATNQCIEFGVPPIPGTVKVRDSKDENPNAPILTFSTQAWIAFANAAARGEFGDV